jgi:transcriptional regulator with PAS, ATPase and Fis domain
MPSVPKELYVLLANYPFPGNIRELKAMVHDAMSVHQEMMLSMKVFKRAMDQKLERETPVIGEESTEENVFKPSAQLPALHEVADLLVAEAMKRAEGNQSIACRLLGISQPALSKRLKKMEK